MKIQPIVGIITWIVSGLIAIALPEMSPKQTADEIQKQKDLANQPLLPGAPEDSKTPLQLFDSYFAAKSRIDASEFNWFTKDAIADYFDDSGELTEQDRKNISEGAKESGFRGYKVLRFIYHADAEKPSIVFGYTYLENGKTAVPITRYQVVKLDLVKTDKGWRIDRFTEMGGW